MSLLPAFEDGTDTWFRNVGILHIDAGEIPKRTYTIQKTAILRTAQYFRMYQSKRTKLLLWEVTLHVP